MRRRPNLRKAADGKRPSKRRPDVDALVVATFHPDSTSVATQPPPSATTDSDPVEEAVRRMVEAAYT